MVILKNGKTSLNGNLEIDGAATNKVAYNAASETTIDFSKSNLVYSDRDPSTFTLNGIKDGGTYSLAVRGTGSGTSTFTASGFTFRSANNGEVFPSTHTLYTFIVMGNQVYFSMTTGLTL